MNQKVYKISKKDGTFIEIDLEQAVNELTDSGYWKGTHEDIKGYILEQGKLWTPFSIYELIINE